MNVRALRTASVLVLATALLAAGCSRKADEPALEPKIAPPLIAEAGVLRAGVDPDLAPFAGEVGGETVGLDVDVAAALAERLGLSLELVDIAPDDLSAALSEGKVDIALGATPITDAVLANATVAGSYFVDGPAMFVFSGEAGEVASTSDEPTTAAGVAAPSTEATLSPDALGALRLATQEGSLAYWRVQSDYGEGFAQVFPAVREAFVALVAGEVDVVVCDAVVGAYLSRDFEGVLFSGQYGTATPLGVTVAKDATDLEAAIREALDALSADGVLDMIRTKWVGDMPRLEVPAEETTATI